MAGRVIPTASKARRSARAALEVTDAARGRLKYLLSQTKDPVIGIRLGLKKRGCNGLSYTMDYAKEKKKMDEVVDADGIKILIEPQALLSIIGTKMDFKEDKLTSEFVFINPNAKSSCGCGESFNVD